jgi:hypothetical protein
MMRASVLPSCEIYLLTADPKLRGDGAKVRRANYYRPRTGNMSNSAAKPAKKSSIDRSPSQGDPTDFGGSKSRKPTGLPEPTATQSGQGRKPSWSELDAKLRVDAAARQAHFELLKKGRRRTDRAPE